MNQESEYEQALHDLRIAQQNLERATVVQHEADVRMACAWERVTRLEAEMAQRAYA